MNRLIDNSKPGKFACKCKNSDGEICGSEYNARAAVVKHMRQCHLEVLKAQHNDEEDSISEVDEEDLISEVGENVIKQEQSVIKQEQSGAKTRTVRCWLCLKYECRINILGMHFKPTRNRKNKCRGLQQYDQYGFDKLLPRRDCFVSTV
jgi:hypothetical protein